jgi:hypothetical protein
VILENTGPVILENTGPVNSDNIEPVISENTWPVIFENTGPVILENTGPVILDNIGPVNSENVGPVILEAQKLHSSLSQCWKKTSVSLESYDQVYWPAYCFVTFHFPATEQLIFHKNHMGKCMTCLMFLFFSPFPPSVLVKVTLG